MLLAIEVLIELSPLHSLAEASWLDAALACDTSAFDIDEEQFVPAEEERAEEESEKPANDETSAASPRQEEDEEEYEEGDEPEANIGDFAGDFEAAGDDEDDYDDGGYPNDSQDRLGSVSSANDEPVPQRGGPQSGDSLISYWETKSALLRDHASNPNVSHTAIQSNSVPQRAARTPGTAESTKRRPSTDPFGRRQLPALTKGPVAAIRRAQTSMSGSRPPLGGTNNSGSSAGSPDRRAATPSVLRAKESLDARKKLEAAKSDRNFWSNRMKMLHREVEKAQSRVDNLRTKSNKFEVSAIESESLAIKIKHERDFAQKQREEKSEAIRANQVAHREAVRRAHAQVIQDKIEQGKSAKVHQKNHQAIVEAMRREEYEEKCRKREKVQQAKVVALLKRVRERAMKDEETKLSYEMRVRHVNEEERAEQERTAVLVSESSKLVQRIRKLRGIEQKAAATANAQRSLDSKLFQPSQ